MMVFDQGIECGFAAATAHRKKGEFAREVDEVFQNQGRGRELLLQLGNIGRSAQYPLALAVIAKAACFENTRQAQLFYRRVQLRRGVDGGELRGGNTELLKKRLLVQPVLRGLERPRGRKYRDVPGQMARRFHRDILKLVGHQRQAMSKLVERFVIRVLGGDPRRNAAYRGLRRRVKETKVKIERVARQREHVAQLPAAQNPDGHLPFPFLRREVAANQAGSGTARTLLV